ncbi:MAG: HRDC domain-containing protein [Pseudomonadota bacterium]
MSSFSHDLTSYPLMQKLNVKSIQWLSTGVECDAVLNNFLQAFFVSLDCEFERQTTFFLKPALLQISNTEQVFLIDCAQGDAIHSTVLQHILKNPAIQKVVHSGQEDIEMLHQMGMSPHNLFDTQWADAYLREGGSRGLQKLVEEWLDLPLPKAETQSNWLQRPLSDEQLIYAAADAQVVALLYPILREKLEKNQHWSYVYEDCQWILQPKTVNPKNYWLEISDAWFLSHVQRARLYKLCEWRENKVRELNIPRRWLISDVHLYKMAEYNITSFSQLKNILSQVKNSVHHRFWPYAEECIDVMNHSENSINFLELPLPPLGRSTRKVQQQMADVINVWANKLGLPRNILASKRWLNGLLRNHLAMLLNQQTESYLAFIGWRSEQILPDLLQVLDQNSIELKDYLTSLQSYTATGSLNTSLTANE